MDYVLVHLCFTCLEKVQWSRAYMSDLKSNDQVKQRQISEKANVSDFANIKQIFSNASLLAC